MADAASWVGLGWALNAGGVVTRVARGIADEKENGWFNRYASAPLARNISVLPVGGNLPPIIICSIGWRSNKRIPKPMYLSLIAAGFQGCS